MDLESKVYISLAVSWSEEKSAQNGGSYSDIK